MIMTQNLTRYTTTITDSADSAHRSPDVLLNEIPFAFSHRGRLRNDYKRRRRRRPRGVAHSTLFTPTPIKSSETRPAHSRWICIFGARAPFPVGHANQLRPTPKARSYHCDLCSPAPLSPSFLRTFLLFFRLITHSLAYNNGITAVALLRGRLGKYQYSSLGLLEQ
jgi:hypothetical protein